MVHVVYCDNAGKKGDHEIDRILSGQKTMALRGAGGRKIPHSRVFSGEMLYFMEKGSKKISAQAIVTNVSNYVKLSESETDSILTKNADKLAFSEKQRERWFKSCLCLVEFDHLKPLIPAMDFDKQTNMDDWLIIEKIEDVVVGTSIPYNYEHSRF